jgi:outer membrane scaffolding protein for murein synthesis (MipA/OmpV family)
MPTPPSQSPSWQRLVACSLVLAGPVHAQAGDDQPARPERPLWEAGLVVAGATQPAYPGAEDRTGRALPLPYIIYRGPYLRADEDNVGVRALRTPRVELNLGFGGSLGSSSDDIEARRGMPDLGTLIEVGPRLVWNLVPAPAGQQAPWRLQIPLRAVLDLNDRLRYRGLALAPELVHERRVAEGWEAGARFGPVFGDRLLADTFYGVDTDEATRERPAYEARAGLIAWRFGLAASHAWSPDVRLFGFARFDSVRGAANEGSPLVRREDGWSAGVGLAWTLARSSRPASD